MEKVVLGLIALVLGIFLAVGISAVIAIPVWLLWNAVIPTIFVTLPQIGFMQAWGLSLLCSLLFKSTGSSSSSK